MAEATGPSPKRRRTDNSSVTTISPEQILQSNATVQHFTGQRHNRWMQGFVSSSGNRDGGDTNASSRNANRQTANGPAPGRATSAETRSECDNLRGQSLNSMANNTGAAHANWQVRSDVAGTTEGSPAVSASRASIVNYESPYTSNLPSATNERSSMDRNMSTNTPGLPSPAPSDKTINSPVTGSTMPPSATIPNLTLQPPKRGPGRPRKHPFPTPILPSNSPPIMSPAMQQQQHRPQAPPGGSISGAGPVLYIRSNAHSPTATHQRTSSARGQSVASATQASARPLAASPTLQQSPNNLKMLTPNALKDRIDSFEQRLQCMNHPPGIDQSRLSLLRDAVSTQIDWFYLALSQVHALMQQQHPDLPESVRSLPPRCWKYLDDLVCSNTMVSPELLNWLAEFPTPIKDVYADAALSSAYSTYVNAVASFLRQLPTQWDILVAHCRRMQAPPLAQDLSGGLGLRSTVLQSVAFRAIARMIYDTPNDAHVMDHLELLHRNDLLAYNQRYVRQGAEKANAYRAFQRVREAWGQWLQMRQDHEMMQRNLPPISRTAFPNFNPAQFAPDAVAVFYPRQAPGDVVPNNAPFTSQQRQSQQQQQAMIANQQRLQQLQASARPPQPRVNTQSPAQPDMPQRQPPNGFVTMPPQRHGPSPRLVFPHESEGVRSQPTEPNAMRSALHEAHLRSPVSVPLQIGDETPQLYRYVRRYALSPTRLDKDMPINTLTFELPQEEIDKIPKTLPSQNPGELSNRSLSETSQTYRLRCCPIKPQGFPTESDWVVADTNWPDTLYMELNNQMLVTRGPLHHKKYLPIDLTEIVKPGVNEIRAVINRMSIDQRPFDFALAVEMVGVVSHSTLIGRLDNEQSISTATTKSSIQRALAGAGGGDDDDDEIAITSTSMTIKLFDPFSGSKIFTTPVRGANCPHKDCFDLETFLSQCKRDKPGHPTIVDCWRCPLCRGDVRPSVMVRDEWLVDVRKTLEKQGKLDTRAIVVEADGSWKPKPEEKTGVRSASLEREEGAASSAKKTKSNDGTPAPVVAKKVIEIIELD